MRIEKPALACVELIWEHGWLNGSASATYGGTDDGGSPTCRIRRSSSDGVSEMAMIPLDMSKSLQPSRHHSREHYETLVPGGTSLVCACAKESSKAVIAKDHVMWMSFELLAKGTMVNAVAYVVTSLTTRSDPTPDPVRSLPAPSSRFEAAGGQPQSSRTARARPSSLQLQHRRI